MSLLCEITWGEVYALVRAVRAARAMRLEPGMTLTELWAATEAMDAALAPFTDSAEVSGG